MYRQHEIHRNLTSSEGDLRIQRLLAEAQFRTRSAVGRRVCQEFEFYDTRGREQLASCTRQTPMNAPQSPRKDEIRQGISSQIDNQF